MFVDTFIFVKVCLLLIIYNVIERFIMFKYILLCLLLLASATIINAKEFTNEKPKPDESISSLQWNRYTTKNFTILSIDDKQGKWLEENIESIKKWCLTRWGYENIDFNKECRIFVVPNKEMLKNLFNISEPKVEIRKNNDELELSIVWLSLDTNPANVIPTFITHVCLQNLQEKYKIKFDIWFERGIAQLNNTIVEAKNDLKGIAKNIIENSSMFTSEKLFNIKADEFYKLSESKQQMFDNQSLALVLMLRKEFGEIKLHNFVKSVPQQGYQTMLNKIYGFSSYDHFDKSYFTFLKDISNDIIKNKVPNSYIEITPRK